MGKSKNWHSEDIEKIFKDLGTSRGGIEKKEAEKLLKIKGKNSLPQQKGEGIFKIFLKQFKNSLIYILLIAAAVVFLMGDYIDGFVILVVLIFNAVVGTIQEGKAQNTLMALKNFVKTKATVIRGGEEYIIDDEDIVPGDIVILQEGDKIPADSRIFSSNGIKINEASLTGESRPVSKIGEKLDSKKNLQQMRNIAFKGTHVASGNGRAVVFATGKDTYIGRISQTLSSIDTEIPLKKKIRYLSKFIVIVVSILSLILFLSGIGLGRTAIEMFKVVVSLAVSVIPEGLPIVLTLVLVMGVYRMGKKNVLIKKIQAVEGLGQIEVLAVDKTGTITKNEMVVKKIYLNGKEYNVSGIGYEPVGKVLLENGEEPSYSPNSSVYFAGVVAFLSSSAHVSFVENEKKWRVTGDPTEAALKVFSHKTNINEEDIRKRYNFIAEEPFDYKKKYRAVLYEDSHKKDLFVIGAPEKILEKSTLENSEKEQDFLERMSLEGFRVVAFAYKRDVEMEDLNNIERLEFGGFFAIQDALRPEVKNSAIKARSANVRVVMITGDHKKTARVIATEAGIYREGDEILTGEELEKINDRDLLRRLYRVSVFARVNPEHKLRIIELYKKDGKVIAMTGDGVNDAPSLVAADVGVSMGGIGTEVAKEASDIVLLDDNFGSVITAMEEGRAIYKTIKRVILYLFSTSAGEMLTILTAVLIGFKVPILAVQILWLNVVTDGFLDMALAVEPKEEGLLKRKLSERSKWIVDGTMIERMIFMSIPMAIGTIILFSLYQENDINKAWTISLSTLAVFQWFNAWNCKSETKSIFNRKIFNNKYLIGATFLVVGLHMLAVYSSFGQSILKTVPLSLSDWLLVLPVGASIILVEEIRKFFYRRKISLEVLAQKFGKNKEKEEFWQPL